VIIIDDIEQGTPEWDRLRIGNPGASSMSRIITTKGKPSASADKYLLELFDEIILDRKTPTYSSNRMKEGILYESDSRDWYEFDNNVEIQQVALCYKDDRKLFHISPDGIFPEVKRGWETKDALPHIQDERLKDHARGGKSFLMQHFVQAQTSLYVTDYDSWVLRSYCRNMPSLNLIVLPDLEFHKALEGELYKLIGKLTLMVKEYKEAA
jgi:hypothetical protein